MPQAKYRAARHIAPVRVYRFATGKISRSLEHIAPVRAYCNAVILSETKNLIQPSRDKGILHFAYASFRMTGAVNGGSAVTKRFGKGYPSPTGVN